MNYNVNTYTSLQYVLLLSIYIGICHEPRHELYYNGNTVIVEFNSI